MSILNSNWTIETGENGSAVLTETGRCTADEAAAIEAGCTRSYELIRIPHASGVVLKALDGTNPVLYTVTHPTSLRVFTCVKVDARTNSFAATQPTASGWIVSGKAVLRFMRKYQEVGSIA